MTRNYFSGPDRCEGCGLFKREEETVKFRPEVGRIVCNDCIDPQGYAASQGMIVEPDPLRILAAL